jgi:hypothetical protein
MARETDLSLANLTSAADPGQRPGAASGKKRGGCSVVGKRPPLAMAQTRTLSRSTGCRHAACAKSWSSESTKRCGSTVQGRSCHSSSPSSSVVAKSLVVLDRQAGSRGFSTAVLRACSQLSCREVDWTACPASLELPVGLNSRRLHCLQIVWFLAVATKSFT